MQIKILDKPFSSTYTTLRKFQNLAPICVIYKGNAVGIVILPMSKDKFKIYIIYKDGLSKSYPYKINYYEGNDYGYVQFWKDREILYEEIKECLMIYVSEII